MAVKDWSTTPSSNATADAASGVNFAEGQAPGSLNDSMRALMAVIKGDFANSLTANGYQKLPNGLILQWGRLSVTTGDLGVTFPIAFPNAAFSVTATASFPAPNGTTAFVAHATDLSKTSFAARARSITSGGVVAPVVADVSWFAIGY